jgi:hypothetical protein
MNKVVLVLLLLLIPGFAFAQANDVLVPVHEGQFGMGFQFSTSSLVLLSWQTADENGYGRCWQIEPMFGGAYTASDYSTISTNAAVTVGVGAYRRWRVRAPYNDIYFMMGPRLFVSGAYSGVNTERLTTSLGFLAGPEYSFDKWAPHFSIAGFAAVTGSVSGRSKSGLPWSANVATSTGIVLRYYVR